MDDLDAPILTYDFFPCNWTPPFTDQQWQTLGCKLPSINRWPGRVLISFGIAPSHKISRSASSGSKPKLNKYSGELTQNKVGIASRFLIALIDLLASDLWPVLSI